MKCPLMMIAEAVRKGRVLPSSTNCLKEECAWWNKRFNRCAMLGCLHELSNLVDKLVEIRDKLPSHERLV